MVSSSGNSHPHGMSARSELDVANDKEIIDKLFVKKGDLLGNLYFDQDYTLPFKLIGARASFVGDDGRIVLCGKKRMMIMPDGDHTSVICVTGSDLRDAGKLGHSKYFSRAETKKRKDAVVNSTDLSLLTRIEEKMETLSIEELSRVFSDPQNAARILQMNYDELANTDAGKAYILGLKDFAQSVSTMFRPPEFNDLALEVLSAAGSTSSTGKFYGVKSIYFIDDSLAYYLENGDTYADTLIFSDQSYQVQSMGDFIEKSEVKTLDDFSDLDGECADDSEPSVKT